MTHRLYADENFPFPVVEELNRRDFIRLHRDRPDHCGVIVCTFDPDFASQARHIVEALASTPTLTRQLIRVYRTVK